jgi:Pyruvate/2-oxoacid:ferredoxin oxidoreductase delta subunit
MALFKKSDCLGPCAFFELTADFSVSEMASKDKTPQLVHDCKHCGKCEMYCPTGAIRFDPSDTEIWQLDRVACKECGICMEICPTKCLGVNNDGR